MFAFSLAVTADPDSHDPRLAEDQYFAQTGNQAANFGDSQLDAPPTDTATTITMTVASFGG